MAEEFPHGYALIIGVGGNLPATVRDAEDLAKVLKDPTRAGYPSKNVETLTGEQATRAEILSAFDRLQKRVHADPQATVFLYYSGHGGRVRTTPPQYYLIPHGYNKEDRPNTAISGPEFSACIAALKPKKLVLFMDCCFAAAIKDEEAEDIELSPVPSGLALGEGQVLMASSREDEYSYVGNRNSIFTKCLLEALAGKGARTADGMARILDLIVYLFDEVPARAKDYGAQHPLVQKATALAENFPLCYYAGGQKSLPGLPEVQPVRAVSGFKRERMEDRRADLQGPYALLREKVRRLREDLVIEAGSAVKFQLEKQLQREERDLAAMAEELEQIEAALEG